MEQPKLIIFASGTKDGGGSGFENMVKATGNKIGFIRSARMGVFQITPITSTDVSDWGVNDTSSLEKKVMAVVSASFAIE